MSVDWTPENKKKAWITRRTNKFLKKGATKEIAVRDAEEDFNKLGLLKKWTEDENIKSVGYEKIKEEKICNLVLTNGISRKEAVELIDKETAISEENENDFVDDEPLIDIEGVQIRHDGRQYILNSHGKNYSTYYMDLKSCLKQLFNREFGLGKKNLDSVLDFINELSRTEKRIEEIAAVVGNKVEKILNAVVS